MFRRRDEEENESNAAAQSALPIGNESVKILAPEAQPYAAPSQSGQPASPLSATYPMSNPSARSAEPASRMGGAPAGGFRGAPAPEVGRARAAEGKSAPSFSAPVASERSRESRRVLTVGSDILLKGEIATCDRLVIEGKVDAVLNDVGTVELAESGSFKGVAQVENAEISGLFEGELVVKGRLVIYASGRVRGKVTYGEIEIERGGELTGEIKTMNAAAGMRSGRTVEKSALKEDKVKAEAA